MRRATSAGSSSAPSRARRRPSCSTPKTGRETRELLAEHSGDLFKRAQDVAGQAQDRAGDLFDKGREYFEEQAQRLTSAFEAGRSAMKDEITRGRSSN